MKQNITHLSFLIAGLMSMLPTFLSGQTTPVIIEENVLNLLSEDLSVELLDFIQKEDLLATLNLADIIPFKDWRKLIYQQTEKAKASKVLPTKLTIEALTLSPPANSFSLDLPTNYTNIKVQSGYSLGKIPLKFQGRIVTTDFQFQPRLSNFSIDFNPLAYLNQLKSKYQINPSSIIARTSLDKFEKPKLPNDPSKESAAFTAREQAIIINEVKFQLYQYLITHPKYIALVAQKDTLNTSANTEKISFQNNSLKAKEKGTTPLTDSLQQFVQKKEMLIDSLQLIYQQQWVYRKSYYTDTLQAIKQKINSYAKNIHQYNDPAVLRQEILTDTKQSLLTKFLAASKKIAIGQSVINDVWYTAPYLPINGFQYAFEGVKWFGTIAFGKQVYQTNFSPIGAAKVFNQIEGARVFMVKGGYTFADKKSKLTYSFIQLKEQGNFDQGIVLAPQNNAIFSVAGSGQLSDKIGINTSISFSRNVWGQTDLATSKQINNRTIAGETTVVADLMQGDLTLAVGYYFVGADYIAAANPFLQNNQHGLVTKLNGRLGEKLAVSASFKSGKTLDASITGGDQSQIQLLGAVNWYPIVGLTISGQIAPNTFKHFGNGTATTTGTNTLYNLQMTRQSTLKDRTILLTGGYTNYNSQWQHYDSTLINQTNHFFIQQTLVFANQSQLSLMNMLGLDADKQIDKKKQYSFFSELSYQLAFPKGTTTMGLQLIKDAVSATWYYGLTTTQAIKLGSTLALSTNFSWQLPYKQPNNKHRYWGQLALTKQF